VTVVSRLERARYAIRRWAAKSCIEKMYVTYVTTKWYLRSVSVVKKEESKENGAYITSSPRPQIFQERHPKILFLEFVRK
jgi:hypothetical protein